MHHAMEPEGANPQLNAHPDLRAQIGRYTYHVETKDGHSTYSVSDGTGTIALPIRWIFGERSQTWLLEKDGQYYESLVSYFDRDQQLATTPGDQSIEPQSLAEAVGRELPVWETRDCFTCHASNVGGDEKLVPSRMKPGLTCERCHAGALQHRADAARGDFKIIPKPLARLNAEQISDLCGQCHRTFDTVMLNRAHNIGFVRFQPYRLELSKCFIGNDPRISCIACHDPHQAVNGTVSFYDAKCLACHRAAQKSAAKAGVKVCPAAKSNCISCHMPKVEIAGKHAQFTDHYIRITHPGEEFPE
jgi:Cytochrome c554 and c-prime